MDTPSRGDQAAGHPGRDNDVGDGGSPGGRRLRWTHLRIAGFLILAALTIAVYLQGAPDLEDHSDAITAALADEQINAASASSAPQQQVVNGWVARDLLTVLAEQQEASNSRDSRPVALLTLAVVALAWHGIVPRETPDMRRGVT